MAVKERHEHTGHSSAEGIDIVKVLSESGVKEGMTVLDLGCGRGDYSLGAASIVGPEGRIYAMDADPDSLMDLADRVYERAIENIMMIRSDMTKGVPLSDHEADVVLMFNVLHGLVWNEEGEMPLKELKRIIKKGGLLSVMESIPGREGHGPPEEVRLSRDRILAILAPLGFRTLWSKEVVPGRDLVVLTRT
jgi:ubiquinone/menaquinone biosynthesis C-methylase UbiE